MRVLDSLHWINDARAIAQYSAQFITSFSGIQQHVLVVELLQQQVFLHLQTSQLQVNIIDPVVYGRCHQRL